MESPVFNKLLQVGLVVKNLDEAVKKYEQFGLGPWTFKEYGPSNLGETTVRGERADFTIRAAFWKVGEVDVELIEPLDDQNIYAEFLRQHGEGLHHLGMGTSDGFEKTISLFASKGVEVLQGGPTFAYFDSEKELSFIAEIFNMKYSKYSDCKQPLE